MSTSSNEQTNSNLFSIFLSAIGIILLVFLLVSIYVNGKLLPDETNQLTKFIISALISGSILIILGGIMLAVTALKILFTGAQTTKSITPPNHRRFKSLDQPRGKNSNENWEFVV